MNPATALIPNVTSNISALTMKEIDNFKFVKIGVNNNPNSKFLFKYRTVAAVKNLLKNGCLWFANPHEFNDPFDCQILPNTNNSEAELQELFEKYAGSVISRDKINELASIVHKDPNKWKNCIEEIFNRLVNSAGICCFTTNEKDLLMWSHYSDSHKGVCLKFDTFKDPEFFVNPLPIKYANEYPEYSHLTNSQQLVQSTVLSKSLDWKYEDEVRVIKINEHGLKPFAKKALIEIIFGCKSSQQDIAEIIELATTNDFKITFKRAERKNREFSLKFIDL